MAQEQSASRQPTEVQWRALRESEARVLAALGVPVAQHDIEIAGELFHYIEAGETRLPTLVMIHGRGGSAGLWYSVIPLLAPHRHLIALDMRGWGLSSRAPYTGERTGQAATDWWRDGALAVIDQLGITRCDLMGHSLGGMVSLAVALARPTLIEHLVLEDAAGFGTHTPLLSRLYFAITPESLARVTPRPIVNALNGFTDPHKQGMRVSKRDLDEYVYQLTTLPGTDVSGVRAFTEIVSLGGVHFTLRDRVREIQTPTRAIWGAKDQVVPLNGARAGLETMPNAEIVVIPGAGHSPHFEQPQAFARVALEFLARGSETPVTETT